MSTTRESRGAERRGVSWELMPCARRKQMDINVCSTILIVQALLKYLARPSRIVLLSSVSARGGFVSQTVYDQSSAPLHRAIADERTVGATKASLEHFARVWSKELGQKYGTTVNCGSSSSLSLPSPAHPCSQSTPDPSQPTCGSAQQRNSVNPSRWRSEFPSLSRPLIVS